MKELFLYIKINKKRNKKKTTKDTLVKEYNKKINKLMESEKHGEQEKRNINYSDYAIRKKKIKYLESNCRIKQKIPKILN